MYVRTIQSVGLGKDVLCSLKLSSKHIWALAPAKIKASLLPAVAQTLKWPQEDHLYCQHQCRGSYQCAVTADFIFHWQLSSG